jgi:hypothetical protein
MLLKCLQGVMQSYKFHEYPYSESHAYRHKLIWIRTFNIYCPNWVKFGIRYMYVMFFTICEFGDNW